MISPPEDKAGQAFWDKNWTTLAPEFLDLQDRRLSNEVNLRLHELFASFIQRDRDAGKRLLEVGCARSVWLPYFATAHGLRVTGLDYSAEGCRQSEAVLTAAGIAPDVHCADMFDPPARLRHTFDYVFTMGVVEHFSDTAAAITALGRFLLPGGLAITVIPNMHGTTGTVQKLLDPQVYATHVALDPRDLRAAHEHAGFEVLHCSYFMATNYYVVNTLQRKGSPSYPVVRAVGALLGRASMAVWQLERWLGRLPATRSLSPYVVCLARRAA